MLLLKSCQAWADTSSPWALTLTLIKRADPSPPPSLGYKGPNEIMDAEESVLGNRNQNWVTGGFLFSVRGRCFLFIRFFVFFFSCHQFSLQSFYSNKSAVQVDSITEAFLVPEPFALLARPCNAC